MEEVRWRDGGVWWLCCVRSKHRFRSGFPGTACTACSAPSSRQRAYGRPGPLVCRTAARHAPRRGARRWAPQPDVGRKGVLRVEEAAYKTWIQDWVIFSADPVPTRDPLKSISSEPRSNFSPIRPISPCPNRPIKRRVGARAAEGARPAPASVGQFQPGRGPTQRQLPAGNRAGGKGVSPCGRRRKKNRNRLSAVSKPNFASKYSLESSRRDLH